jgi:thiol-disulfide isomerase/thioredoxin
METVQIHTLIPRAIFAAILVSAVVPATADDNWHPAVPLPVPALTVTDKIGQAVTIPAGHSRVTILDIWATWCPSCRTEFPKLDRLQAEFDPRDVVVLPVSIDQGSAAAAVERFYRAAGVQHVPIYLDTTKAVLTALNIKAVPMTLILNADGAEIGRVNGAADWDSPAMVKKLSDLVSAEKDQCLPTNQQETC